MKLQGSWRMPQAIDVEAVVASVLCVHWWLMLGRRPET